MSSAPLAERWADAWTTHDPARVAGWYAADGIHRMAGGATYAGRDALHDMAARALRAYPDLTFVVRDAFVTAGRFAIEYTMHGTQVHGVGNRPGTGRTVTVDGALVGTLDEAGLVTSVVDYLDHLVLRRQLGLADATGDATSGA